MLECPDIIKVFHDCRNDSGVLHAQHGILLQNIFDTQVITMQAIARCNDSIHRHARSNGFTMMYLQTIKMLRFNGRCKMKKRKCYSNPYLAIITLSNIKLPFSYLLILRELYELIYVILHETRFKFLTISFFRQHMPFWSYKIMENLSIR